MGILLVVNDNHYHLQSQHRIGNSDLMKTVKSESAPLSPRLPQSQAFVPLTVKPSKLEDKDLKAILRQADLKITDQRMLILREFLLSKDRHMTAQQLYEAVLEKDTSVGFATVYRLLRSLTDAGIMTETRMGGVSARYEFQSKNHHDHLTCESCGLIREFENTEIERLQQKVAEEFGFVLTHHVLELFGLCRSCRKKV